MNSISLLNKSLKRIVLFGLLIIPLIFGVTSCDKKVIEVEKETTVRIGWQIAWATQGQLAQVLINTNALQLCDLKGDFKSFTYGAPLSEAALAGQLDVAFIGDQPAVNLLSRSNDWKLVAKLMDFRVAIVIPMNSPIKSIADLKGKTLGIPFGASTHRVALQMLEEAGLNPTKDVNIVNIDILEQSDIVNSGKGKSWPKVDAFASWDHHIALYESKGLAKILKSGTALGVIAISQKFIDANPEAAISFLAAFKLAYYYYANNQDQADKWFFDAAEGKFDLKILRDVGSFEPNLSKKQLNEMAIDFSTQNITMLQTAAHFAYNQKLIQHSVKIQDLYLRNLLDQSEKLMHTKPLLTAQLKKIK
jgi:ABC-type nitrate/sulfonate/bicarbonate transport system substrate-binding protein